MLRQESKYLEEERNRRGRGGNLIQNFSVYFNNFSEEFFCFYFV